MIQVMKDSRYNWASWEGIKSRMMSNLFFFGAIILNQASTNGTKEESFFMGTQTESVLFIFS